MDNYLERRREYIEDLTNHLRTITSFKEIRAQTRGTSIQSSYNFIAIFSLLLVEIRESKKYLYKSARLTEELFKIFYENRYPNLIKSETFPFTTLFATSFWDAILSDSEELLKEYALTIADRGKVDPPFNYEIKYAEG